MTRFEKILTERNIPYTKERNLFVLAEGEGRGVYAKVFVDKTGPTVFVWAESPQGFVESERLFTSFYPAVYACEELLLVGIAS